MAAKFALIVLACAIAACNAEAPFRGYRAPQQQQQQSGPYPAAGFKPERAFNLPSDESIAQQLRLAQIIRLQQQIQREQQQRPSQLYGAPSESEASAPQQPSGLYGAPQEEASSQQPSSLTRPQRPSQTYGPPQEAAASQRQPTVLRPVQPSRQYGAPQQAAPSQRQTQRQPLPSRQYGPPSEAPATQATPEGNSAESLEETKEVETVAAVANSIDNKPGRLTQGERDTENDEAETNTNTATAPSGGLFLVPFTAAGYVPQKLAYFQAPAVAPAFAKLQLPTVFGLQQKLLAPQLLAPQGYYQPQQFAFAAPLQAAQLQAAPLQPW